MLDYLATMNALASAQSDSRGRNSSIAPYLQQVSKRVLHCYIVPGGYEPVYAKVSFNVERSGRVTTAKLLDKPVCIRTKQPSALTNAALIRALENSSPLPPPPNNLKTPIHLIAVFDGRDLTKSVSCAVQQGQ